jgi:sugar phosphate isomerase/epimerase
MFPAYYTGFADEAGSLLDTQIKATKELGWSAIEMRNVEVPGFPGGNLHDIPDEAFDAVAASLEEAGVRVNCLGSAIANGGKDIRKPFECRDAALRAVRRARRLGAEFIRVMSYPVGDPNDLLEEERVRRLREIVVIFADSGTTVVHENCNNYGGMGWTYSLRLLDRVPGLKLVFDMGNCPGDADFTKAAPHPRQNAWEFYRQVRDHIVYVHIKDARWIEATGEKQHVFPGCGEGHVREIIADLLRIGYTGGLSIEPHMHAGLPAELGLTDAENRYRTYVEYGRRLEHLVESIRAEDPLVEEVAGSE